MTERLGPAYDTHGRSPKAAELSLPDPDEKEVIQVKADVQANAGQRETRVLQRPHVAAFIGKPRGIVRC